MRKLSAAVLALSVATLGIPVLAHGKPKETTQDEKKPQQVDIKGSVKADAPRSSLLPMRAEKPEMSTILSAHVYPDKSQIHVMTVTML